MVLKKKVGAGNSLSVQNKSVITTSQNTFSDLPDDITNMIHDNSIKRMENIQEVIEYLSKFSPLLRSNTSNRIIIHNDAIQKYIEDYKTFIKSIIINNPPKIELYLNYISYTNNTDRNNNDYTFFSSTSIKTPNMRNSSISIVSSINFNIHKNTSINVFFKHYNYVMVTNNYMFNGFITNDVNEVSRILVDFNTKYTETPNNHVFVKITNSGSRINVRILLYNTDTGQFTKFIIYLKNITNILIHH